MSGWLLNLALEQTFSSATLDGYPGLITGFQRHANAILPTCMACWD